MNTLRRLLLAVVSMSVAATSSPAAAQGPAAHHYRAGTSYYAQGRYKDALREFEESYRLSKKPELHYNIGQTYERMGRIDDAIARYKRYIKESGDKNATLLEKIKNLERRLAATGISLSCKVDGAEVIVDGKKIGVTPLKKPIALHAGSHNVEVKKAGYRSFSAFVSVTVGSVIAVTAALMKDTTGAVSGTGTGAGAGASTGTGAGAGTGAGTSSGAGVGTGSEKRSGRMWTWILAAGAGALFVTAAATGGAALSKASNAVTDSDSKADAARRLALTSDITLGLGIAATVGAVIAFFVEGKRARKRATTTPSGTSLSAAPMLGPGLAGAAATLTF
ncbi:MAG: PEGA domain-containing protein [Myxococcales bacterium]|nr:PEGA domain-containing protein [Myxococcales bacterium]